MSIEQLLETDIQKHVEKKGAGNRTLSYLSWAWAWAYAIKADPKATYKIELFQEYGENGRMRTVPYMNINGTAMVMVTVTIFDKPMTCQLPVMDHRNQAIENPDAFAVNTAIMRCLAKGLGLHGLGLSLYAGEDLIDIEMPKKKADVPIITPRNGIGDDLSPEIKESLLELKERIIDLIAQDRPKEALFAVKSEQLEADQEAWLWDQLDSKVRSALKKAKEAK